MRPLLVLSLLLAGCGTTEEEVTLGGSVGRIHSLEYETVRARLTDRAFAIQYVDGGEVPVEVVVRLDDVMLTGPGTIDLGTHGEVVGDREVTRMPDFISGSLTLRQFAPTEGARVSGEFQAEVGSASRTYAVFGSFDTPLEVIQP